MNRKNKLFAVAFCGCVALFSALSGFGQSGGINDNFSPYTMYGIGVLDSPAAVNKKIMGGVGIASSDIAEFNYLNPAALGAVPQRSALFSFGINAQNYYSTTTSKNAFGKDFSARAVGNIASLNAVGLAFPLARGVAFSVALTPVSSVGYNSTLISQNDEITDDIGRVYYTYKGEGGVSAVTGSVGVRVAKGLNLGASLIYYFGSIDRYYNATVYPMINQSSYSAINTVETNNISKIGGAFGAQYSFRVSRTGYITLGATYQLKTTIKADVHKLTYSQSATSYDTIRFLKTKNNITMPSKYGAGLAFKSSKFEAEFNYTYQDWKGAFDTDFANTGVALTKQQDFRFGFGFTPNRGDIRKTMNRWTYKVGAHYGLNYLMKNGVNTSQFSVTLGADLPLKINSPTRLSFGFEFGKRGTMQNSAVTEKFFKVLLGFSFFGDDMWFEKRKFN